MLPPPPPPPPLLSKRLIGGNQDEWVPCKAVREDNGVKPDLICWVSQDSGACLMRTLAAKLDTAVNVKPCRACRSKDQSPSVLYQFGDCFIIIKAILVKLCLLVMRYSYVNSLQGSFFHLLKQRIREIEFKFSCFHSAIIHLFWHSFSVLLVQDSWFSWSCHDCQMSFQR